MVYVGVVTAFFSHKQLWVTEQFIQSASFGKFLLHYLFEIRCLHGGEDLDFRLLGYNTTVFGRFKITVCWDATCSLVNDDQYLFYPDD
jgi:hypothetical protein